jgi:hypothetical protein
VTGRPVLGSPVVVTGQPCRLSQRATTNVSSASEVEGSSSFTTTLGDVLFPPGTVVSAKTEVVDVGGVLGGPGAVWRVEGKPAVRRPFTSATLLLISDMQGA